jgi:hypothetical protein
MTDEEKSQLIDEVINGFDFEKARKAATIRRKEQNVQSIERMKASAREYLQKALEHQDREFWWIGGMHHGGLCACYDNKWGLSLNYIAVASRQRIFKTKKL